MSALTTIARIPAGRRTTWLVLLFWIAIVFLAVPLAGKVGEVENNEASSFLPRAAQSTQVEELAARFAADGNLAAVVVYVREGGLTAADRAAAEQGRSVLATIAVGGSVEPAVPSADGAALLLAAPIANGDGLIDAVTGVRAQLAAGAPPGLQVSLTGPVGGLVDSVSVFDGLDVTLLAVSAAVVAVLLLLTYRSPVLWLVPLVSVGIATQVANAVIYLLGRYAGLPVDGQSAGILTVLVFGVGTDYALLLVARYREELHRHDDRHAAMALAVRHAGPAIVASAGTVILGLLCLLAADLNSTRSLGGVGAIGVGAALLVMVTLLPALLVLLGRGVFWPLVPRSGTPVRAGVGAWAALAAGLARRPRLVWTATTAGLVVLALAATGLSVGLTQEQSFRTTPESVVGQRLLDQHYPSGSSAPTEIVVDAEAADQVADVVRGVAGVARVQPGATSTDGRLAKLDVVLTDPPDSDEAKRTVQRLRAAVDAVPAADALVGGPTAAILDTETAAAADRRIVLPLVLGVVLLVLILLLRSLVAPLLLIATVVLSFLAALGAATVLFDTVFGFDAVDHSLPLLGFVFLVALGVDYNIFLMSRVREELRRHDHADAVRRGLAATGGVITSAGLVLAATFTVLTVTPVVFLVSLGALVAVGVLLDTFVVRSLLVPALALDLGPHTWWPGRSGATPSPSTTDPEPELATQR